MSIPTREEFAAGIGYLAGLRDDPYWEWAVGDDERIAHAKAKLTAAYDAALARIAELEAIQGKAFALAPGAHEDGAECSTWYDGCHCTNETLAHNIKRADEAEKALAVWAEFRAQNLCSECKGEPWRRPETQDEEGEPLTFGEPETCPLCDGTGMRFVEMEACAEAYQQAAIDLWFVSGEQDVLRLRVDSLEARTVKAETLVNAHRARIVREFLDEACPVDHDHQSGLWCQELRFARWEAAAKGSVKP